MIKFIKSNLFIKKYTLRIISFFLFFGLDLKRIFNLLYLPRFIKSLINFKKNGKINKIKPILNDFSNEVNLMSGHYFHQDLIVANKVFKNNPKKHVDIGSRVDGFVSHVASFRTIETYDLRAIGISKHKNIKINIADITNSNNLSLKTDSLSCLHSIEHFGLGRYGDDLDPEGHIKGFQNLLKLLEKDGLLYISFPISVKTRVEFNEQRVFHYSEILNWLKPFQGEYVLECFDYIDDSDNIYYDIKISNNIEKLKFGCGIYTIRKK